MCVMGSGRIERDIYFKGMAHMIVWIGKSEFCRRGLQAGDPGKVGVTGQVQSDSGGRILSFLRDLSLFL